MTVMCVTVGDELGTRNKIDVCYYQQDCRYASIFDLSMCIGGRIISTKTAPEKFPIISRIRRVRSYVIRLAQSYDNNTTEAMKAHTKTFFSLER